MSQLKSLASQTAVYGVSSILGRLINYLLVGVHTTLFFPEQMGVVTGLYAYTAIFLIIYTMGMETAFFRYAKEGLESAYNTTSTVVIFVSTALSLALFINAEALANLAGYSSATLYVQWLAVILWIDAILAIPFARLRHENKAKKFAGIKIFNILLNVSLQLIFLLIVPIFNTNFKASISYIFLANLIANGAMILFLTPELLKIRIQLHKKTLKTILLYAIPIFFMGLAGMLNEQLDKIFLEQLLPDTFYTSLDSTSALGVYGQTFKLGILMMLAIQAFRYAGEPFFFSKSADRNAPELFARVMHYFVISALLLFVLISVNIDLLAFIFLRNEEFRVALYLVPLILFAKLLYGVYLNLSIWFKLTDRTIYGLYFGLAGLAVTVAGNIVLVPRFGMLGCVYAMIACYLFMCLLCYIVGQRYFPIPYSFVKLLPYIIISMAIVVLGYKLNHPNFIIDSSINILASMLVVGILWVVEKKKLLTKSN